MASAPPGTPWRTVLRRSNDDMLFAEDLGGYGVKPIDVEIIDSGIKTVKSRKGPQKMPWLQFRGKKGPSKKLGLGRGMCKVMEAIAGTDIVERWRGWITLVVVKQDYTDEDTKERLITDAIRIAPKRPRRTDSAPSSLPEPAPEPKTDDPAGPPAEMSDEERRKIEAKEREQAGHA